MFSFVCNFLGAIWIFGMDLLSLGILESLVF